MFRTGALAAPGLAVATMPALRAGGVAADASPSKLLRLIVPALCAPGASHYDQDLAHGMRVPGSTSRAMG
jgi:hypothetical protein